MKSLPSLLTHAFCAYIINTYNPRIQEVLFRMTDLMQVLYEYVEAERLPAYLPPREYQEVRKLTDRLSRQLREMLPEDRWDTLAKYQDAAAELHSMELEAMFQAALSLAGELR